MKHVAWNQTVPLLFVSFPNLNTHLAKKRNATNLTVVSFSVLFIGLKALGDSFIRHITDLFVVFTQAERHLFQCVIPEFGASHCWSFVASAVCFSDQLFYLLITWSGTKILLGFSLVSGHQGLHDQDELREGVRMLMANTLPQCTAGSFGVHGGIIYCHLHRLCET